MLVLALLNIFCSSAQPKISPRLESILQKSNRESIHVVIKLKSFWNVDSVMQVHKIKKLSVHETAKQTIKSIRNYTEKSQKSFIKYIYEIQSQGYDLKVAHQFWSANLISLTGNNAAIRLLATHPDVDQIYLDHTDYRTYPTKEGINEDIKGAATSGIRAIEVQKMWELGYTGRGRKVLGVDTGVYISHPSIIGRFLGLYFPMSESFFGFNNPVPVDISSSTHGTHTIGTVLGTTNPNGDSIGIAYNAYYLVSDPIVSRLSEVRRMSEILECFEWALDPDGNPETTNDIPDVITNSWGFSNSGIIEDCNLPETLVFNVLEAAGVALVFSAGNSGPGTATIGQPAHIARSTTNIFSVGAIDASSNNLYVAGFSSRGPTNCPAEEGSPLHIKPEVVAPGVNVYSAQGLDGYGSLSGTSMAAPHVAGIVLLLKEAFPNISGTEILEAIYETTADLGESGEDNTYGRGIINVWNAYQYLAQTHTPSAPVTGGDIKLIANGIYTDENHSIISTLDLINQGTESTTINQFITHVNDNEHIKDTTIILEPNQALTFSYVLDISSLVDTTIYNVYIYAKPDGETDIDTINNNSWFQLHKPYPVDLPYTETFETANFNLSGSKVTVNNPDNLFTWRVDTIPQFGQSTKSATMKFRFYTEKEEKDYMSLYPINLNSPEELYLGFKYAYAEKSMFAKDSLIVTISTNGLSFTDTIWKNGGTTMATISGWQNSNLFIPNSPDKWEYANVNLSNYRHLQRIWIRFETINDNGNDLFNDDIAVYEG